MTSRLLDRDRNRDREEFDNRFTDACRTDVSPLYLASFIKNFLLIIVGVIIIVYFVR